MGAAFGGDDVIAGAVLDRLFGARLPDTGGVSKTVHPGRTAKRTSGTTRIAGTNTLRGQLFGEDLERRLSPGHSALRLLAHAVPARRRAELAPILSRVVVCATCWAGVRGETEEVQTC